MRGRLGFGGERGRLGSSAYTSVHILVTHMHTHLPYDFHMSFFHSSGPSCVMQKLRVSVSRDVIARLLTDLETRRFGILLSHIGSGAEIFGDVRCN